MVKVNKVSKKNRTSKKQYSKHSKKNKMKKSKRRQYTKKGGGTKTIVNASKTLQNMINNLPDENDKFTGNLDKLVDLVKKYILPQSKDTDIKRYLKLINYYYHYYSTVEGLILTESRKIEYAGSVDSVAFSPDSQYVATGYYDYLTVSYDYRKGYLRIIDVKDFKEKHKIEHGGDVNSVAFSPDSQYVATGSEDMHLRIIDVKTGKEHYKFVHDSWENQNGMYRSSVHSVAFSPDSQYVATGSYDYPKGYLRIIDVKTGKEKYKIAHGDYVCSVAFSPDNKYVATGSYDKHLRVFDAATGQKLHDSNHDSDVDSVVFSPDNNKIAIGSGRKVTIYDLDKEVKTVLAQNKNTDNKKDYTLKDYALNKSDIGPVLAIVDYLGGMGDLLKKLESRYDPTGDILEEFRDEIFKQHKAATKIQAGFRGMRNRKRVKEILKGKTSNK